MVVWLFPFSKETKTWLVEFNNGDTDKYTYIEILGANCLHYFCCQKSQTKMNIDCDYCQLWYYFNIVMNKLIDNGINPNRAELGKKQCTAVLALWFGRYEKTSPTFPSYEKNPRIKYKSPWLSCNPRTGFGLHGLCWISIDWSFCVPLGWDAQWEHCSKYVALFFPWVISGEQIWMVAVPGSDVGV